MVYSKRIIILFFLILLLLSTFSFGVEYTNPTEWNSGIPGATQHDNTFDTLTNIELKYQNDFIAKWYALYGQDPVAWKANLQYIYNDFIYSANGQRGIYVSFDPNSDGYMVGTYTYNSVSKVTDRDTYTFNNQNFNSVAYAKATMSVRYLKNDNSFYGESGVIYTEEHPEAFFYVISPKWIDLFIDTGIITTSTDQKIIDYLKGIYEKAGVTGVNERLDLINSNIGNVNNNISNVDNSIKDVNNSINNSDVNVDSSTLPGDNTNDITGDGFNNIFNQIYTTFTSSVSKDLVITIPFTSKSFTVNSANVYGNANLGFVKILIEAFWYFVISYFIVKDISKKINKIKSGDIEHVEESNVKEDLL